MPGNPERPGWGNYPGGFRKRETFFFNAWARSHRMSIVQARADPAAQGFYANSYGRGRYVAAEAWGMAGVIRKRGIMSDGDAISPIDGDKEEYEYTEEYQ
jgi:hypothetical protein